MSSSDFSGQNIGLNYRLLDEAFPFHIVLNRKLELIQAGSSLLKLCAKDLSGSHFNQLFSAENCEFLPSFNNFMSNRDRSLLIKLIEPFIQLTIKAQILYDETQDVLILIGSPLIQSASDLKTSGLSFSDFAFHDTTLDYLFILKSRNEAISDIQRLNHRLENEKQQARHDELTGLGNRRYLFDKLDWWITKHKNKSTSFNLYFIDCDNFKMVNDNYGHQTGDRLLQELSFRLKAGVTPKGELYRYGGDEFIILYPDTSAIDHHSLLEKLQYGTKKPFFQEGLAIPLSISVGVACYPNDARDAISLIRHADKAMYVLKRKRKLNAP